MLASVPHKSCRGPQSFLPNPFCTFFHQSSCHYSATLSAGTVSTRWQTSYTKGTHGWDIATANSSSGLYNVCFVYCMLHKCSCPCRVSSACWYIMHMFFPWVYFSQFDGWLKEQSHVVLFWSPFTATWAWQWWEGCAGVDFHSGRPQQSRINLNIWEIKPNMPWRFAQCSLLLGIRATLTFRDKKARSSLVWKGWEQSITSLIS